MKVLIIISLAIYYKFIGDLIYTFCLFNNAKLGKLQPEKRCIGRIAQPRYDFAWNPSNLISLKNF